MKIAEIERDMRTLREAFNLFSMTVAKIQKSLDEQTIGASAPNPNIALIQEVVAKHYHLPVSVMRSPIRTGRFVEARHAAMFLSCQLTNNLAEREIGACFDRIHTTVENACRCVRDRMASDPTYKTEIEQLRHSLEMRIAKHNRENSHDLQRTQKELSEHVGSNPASKRIGSPVPATA